MKTKIYVGRNYLGQFTCDGKNYTRWGLMKYRIVRTTKRVMGVLGIFFLGVWGYYGLTQFFPVQVVAVEKEVIVEVSRKSPVMERIADCESGVRDKYGNPIKGSASHLDPKTGQVYTKANTNGTVDIGKYMINEYYNGKLATQMKLDLTKESDNEKMAYHLYEIRGTEPWSASKSCWNK